MKFTEENLREIMGLCAEYVEEVFVETRKSVPQTFYVVKISNDETFWNWESEQIENIPDWAIGYWKTDQADDNTYYTYNYRIKNDDWVKVIQKETITYEWEEI